MKFINQIGSELIDQKTKNTNTLLVFIVLMALSVGCLIGSGIAYSHDQILAFKMLAMALSVFFLGNIYFILRFKN